MQVTVHDFRYKLQDVLKALDKREKVSIIYHGKVKGTIIPARNKLKRKVREHPFFGMKKKEYRSVNKIMNNLRKERYDVV